MSHWGDIVHVVVYRGEVLFVDERRRVWRVWIGADDQPLMEEIAQLRGSVEWRPQWRVVAESLADQRNSIG